MVGTPLKDVKLPRGVMIGALVRGEEVIIPRGNTVIKENDRVVIFAPHDVVKKVERMFAVAIGFF